MKTNENKLAAIVLAAGTSVRMGGNKLLKQWRGKPLLSHCFAAVMDGKNAGLFSFVAAVCGCDAAQTSKLLAAADKIVYNRNYQSGMSSSLICGLDALPQSCAGALIFLLAICRLFLAPICRSCRRLAQVPRRMRYGCCRA